MRFEEDVGNIRPGFAGFAAIQTEWGRAGGFQVAQIAAMRI